MCVPPVCPAAPGLRLLGIAGARERALLSLCEAARALSLIDNTYYIPKNALATLRELANG